MTTFPWFEILGIWGENQELFRRVRWRGFVFVDYSYWQDYIILRHMHEDEEIRYILSGSGFFDVRGKKQRKFRVILPRTDFFLSYHQIKRLQPMLGYVCLSNLEIWLFFLLESITASRLMKRIVSKPCGFSRCAEYWYLLLQNQAGLLF